MKIYLLKNESVAIQQKLLYNLKSQCTKIEWSKHIKNLPNDVSQSIKILKSFSESFFSENCNDNNTFDELNEQEIELMFSLFRKSTLLKEILGSGVVLSGEEASIVIDELTKINALNKIVIALQTGNCIAIM